MERQLGTYAIEIVWLPDHKAVGVWRFECSRCGLVVQAAQGESSDRCHAAARHVCDPSKKDGRPPFDPTEPFTLNEKIQSMLDKVAKKPEKPNSLAIFLDHEAGLHKEPHPDCVHKDCAR
jgi:rubredoxin